MGHRKTSPNKRIQTSQRSAGARNLHKSRPPWSSATIAAQRHRHQAHRLSRKFQAIPTADIRKSQATCSLRCEERSEVRREMMHNWRFRQCYTGSAQMFSSGPKSVPSVTWSTYRSTAFVCTAVPASGMATTHNLLRCAEQTSADHKKAT